MVLSFQFLLDFSSASLSQLFPFKNRDVEKDIRHFGGFRTMVKLRQLYGALINSTRAIVQVIYDLDMLMLLLVLFGLFRCFFFMIMK